MDLFDIAEAEEKNKRIKYLVPLIKKYQKSYYDGEGEVSDGKPGKSSLTRGIS